MLSALALAGCGSDADETQDTIASTAATIEEGTSPRAVAPTATDGGPTAYGDLCETKRQTGETLQDAGDDAVHAMDDGDLEAARAAYVVYYDAYQADVDAIVGLSGAIRNDPSVSEEVVAGAEEAIEAGELFDETIARARSGLESAGSIDDIRQVFTDFNDDLRGTPPDFNPDLLPPAIFRWGMDPDSACNDG